MRTGLGSWWWTERHAVSAPGVRRRQNGTYSAPDDHFTAGPDCRVQPSGIRRVGSAGRRPTIKIGIVSAAVIEIGCVISSTPDDHVASGPDCRVSFSATGCVSGAGGRPTIIGRIVSPTGVQIGSVTRATPDNHFASGPDCRVTQSAVRLVNCTGATQLSVAGSYLPPVFKKRICILNPPQTIISVPVHTAV